MDEYTGEEEDIKKLAEQASKKLEIWDKAMAGDTQALIEVTIMRGMATREDFPELESYTEKAKADYEKPTETGLV